MTHCLYPTPNTGFPLSSWLAFYTSSCIQTWDLQLDKLPTISHLFIYFLTCSLYIPAAAPHPPHSPSPTFIHFSSERVEGLPKYPTTPARQISAVLGTSSPTEAR